MARPVALAVGRRRTRRATRGLAVVFRRIFRRAAMALRMFFRAAAI
jgi:hypothetical protein